MPRDSYKWADEQYITSHLIKKKNIYIYTKEMTKKKEEAHSGFIVNEVRYSVCRLKAHNHPLAKF